MPRRRKLGTILGVMLAGILALSAAGVGWLYLTFRDLGGSLERGLLGPPADRQRVEVPHHRFAISIPDDWVVELDPERDVTSLAHVEPVLLAAPVDGVPRCRVDVLPGGGSLDAETTLLAWVAERANPGAYVTGRAPSLPEDVLGTVVRGPDDAEIAAYWVPLEQDALIVSCKFDGSVDRSHKDDAAFASDGRTMLWFGMPAIVQSIEPLAAPSPSPTVMPLDQGQRVETPTGLMLTFPQDWTITQPDAAYEERVVPSLGDLVARRLAPLVASWVPAPGMAAARYASDDDPAPVESCIVDATPGWLGDVKLEEAVGLVLAVPAEDGDAPEVTYLDLPIGRVARADAPDDGDVVSTYLLSSGGRLHRLVCRGPQGSTTVWDDILSSAEPAFAGG